MTGSYAPSRSRLEAQRIGGVTNDEATSVDQLGRRQYAKAFSRLVQTCDTPFVIGIYGTWGVGKTSLMQLIAKELDSSDSIPIWYDAWAHQYDDNPAVALLHEAVDQLGLSNDRKVQKLLTLIGRALGGAAVAKATSLSISDLRKSAEEYDEQNFLVREARVRLRQHFAEVVNSALAHTPGKQRSARRLVFFIDDLDRCSPATVLAVLESLKLYLNLQNCVYFLAIERGVVERSILGQYGQFGMDEVSYLEKIIQLPFTLPPIPRENMGQFVTGLLPVELKQCSDMLVAALGSNPRQVKRFINGLAFNDQLARVYNIPDYDPRILAALLLVQSLSPEVYAQIEAKPEAVAQLKLDTGDSYFLEKGSALEAALITVANILPSSAETARPYVHLTNIAGVESDRAEPEGDQSTENPSRPSRTEEPRYPRKPRYPTEPRYPSRLLDPDETARIPRDALNALRDADRARDESSN